MACHLSWQCYWVNQQLRLTELAAAKPKWRIHFSCLTILLFPSGHMWHIPHSRSTRQVDGTLQSRSNYCNIATILLLLLLRGSLNTDQRVAHQRLCPHSTTERRMWSAKFPEDDQTDSVVRLFVRLHSRHQTVTWYHLGFLCITCNEHTMIMWLSPHRDHLSTVNNSHVSLLWTLNDKRKLH